MADSLADELLRLNARLLESIASGDWATYEELCDPSLTAFEPDANLDDPVKWRATVTRMDGRRIDLLDLVELGRRDGKRAMPDG